VCVTRERGPTPSPAPIRAPSLGTPAVMGLSGALDEIRTGATLLLDGQSGVVVIEPTRPELEEGRVGLSRRQRFEMQLEAVQAEPARTPDGVAVTLMGNLDLPDE